MSSHARALGSPGFYHGINRRLVKSGGGSTGETLKEAWPGEVALDRYRLKHGRCSQAARLEPQSRVR